MIKGARKKAAAPEWRIHLGMRMKKLAAAEGWVMFRYWAARRPGMVEQSVWEEYEPYQMGR